jgi:hypothetical protein
MTEPGWTIQTWAIHQAALREADLRFDEERDRRYAEVDVEREKALRIKQTADEKALELDQELRAYKDEKANNLRSQIEGERGLYATKDDLAAMAREIRAVIDPVVNYVTLGQGREKGSRDVLTFIVGAAGFVSTVVAIVFALSRG